MNKDTVYRQDAIEGVETKLKKWSLLYRECCSGIGVSYSDVIEMLSDLPSAQSEIAEKLSMYKCYVTDENGLQHEVIHTGDIRRVTGWMI